ncbi:MAG: CvpA family protein [bacterium]
MTWADWAILAILLVSCAISLMRGFIKEVLSLVIWVIAIVLASHFYLDAATLLADLIDSAALQAAAAWILILMVVLLAGALINFLVGILIESTGLSGTDRLLGMIFGFARGAAIVMAIVIFLPDVLPVDEDAWWQESMIIPHFLRFEDWAVETGTTVIQFFKNLF